MMKKTIFLKAFSGYFLLIALLSAAILTYAFQTIREYSIHLMTDDLYRFTVSLRSSIAPFIASKERESLNAFITKLDAAVQTRITIVDSQGVVLADSKENPRVMENHRNRPEIANALEG